MMKKILILLTVLLPYYSVFGQNPGLVTSNSDVIGLTGYPTSPLLIQSGPENFFWIGGAYQGTSVDHFLLNDKVYSDFSSIYFIKYDQFGAPLTSAAISGSSRMPQAFSFEGGLTVMGNSSADIEANGNLIPLNNANTLEFIAKYNDLCQFERIVSVWDLDPSQYPSSRAMMDPITGTLYLAGTSSKPFNLVGYGLIGTQWSDYLYVLRYNKDLTLTGVFTAGFDETDSEYAYYSNLRITPGEKSSVVITGTWQGDRRPVIGDDTLTSMIDSKGVFAFKIDQKFTKEWVLEGSLQGFDYDGYSAVSEGFSLRNGDLVMVGATTTGYFSVGEVQIDFEDGSGSSNMFAFRISPEGAVKWVRPIQNMAWSYGDKKGAKSEEFTSQIDWDAIQWKDEVLYLTGKFETDQFEVAGKPLENKLGSAAFVAAINMNTGEEMWGYSLSSSFVDLYGFDLDGSGNVTLMGKTGSVQEFEVIGGDSVETGNLVFHLGLDNNGKPLWHNNAHLESMEYNFSGTDLEVLKNSEVFSSMYKSVASPLLIGGTPITSELTYTTILAALVPDNELGGKLMDRSGFPVFPAKVKAFMSTTRGAYPIVDSVYVEESGDYLFSGLYPGHYTLLAIPELSDYPDGIPTYAGGATTWTQAQFFDVTSNTRATFLDIILAEVPQLTADNGSGKMSGRVSYADDFVAKGTMARPVTRTSVILIKKAASKGTMEDEVIAYIDTDDLGEYRFDNVPDGDYNLIIDVPGLAMNGNYDVVIQENVVVTGLDFVVDNSGIDTPGGVGIEPVEMDRVRLFPNPGKGMIHIELRQIGDYQVQVFNMVGEMVESRHYFSVSGLVDLDLSNLNSGMYLIKIEGDAVRETVKYIVK